jgi:hypothetical protein
MRYNLHFVLFHPIPIMIPDIAFVKRHRADSILVLRRIVAFAPHAHGFHVVEALRIFVVFREVVRPSAGGEAMGADVEEEGEDG